MSYYMYINKVLFPVTPGKITTKIKSKNKTLSLIDEGEVNLIKTPGLTEITIDELLLPVNQIYPFSNGGSISTIQDGEGQWEIERHAGVSRRILQKHYNADYFLEKLETWKNSKKPVTWKLARLTPNNRKLLWVSNMSVTIEDYEIIEDAERNGLDVTVKLDMKQYREFGAKKLKIKKKKKSSSKTTVEKKKKNRSEKKTKETKYKIKSGDTLYSIARKKLGDGSKWKSIYTLNKKKIEAAAKAHGRKSSSNGHWIYSGTVIKLPT